MGSKHNDAMGVNDCGASSSTYYSYISTIISGTSPMKGLKWILSAISGALGLFISFVVAPTVFECKLFTQCHELNASYAIISIFSSDASTTLANEQMALQAAHSIALAIIFALLGLGIGFAFERYRYPVPAPAVSPGDSRPSERQRASDLLELTGLDRFSAYYLKVDAAELAGMPHGLSVGRDSDCAVFAVTDDTVSREHARLRLRDGHFVLEDMGSTNGTRVNGRALRQSEPTRLHSGDRVTFGSAAFDVKTI